MQTTCVIGIDIGGTTTSLALVDRTGGVLGEATLATHSDQPGHILVDRLCDAVATLLAALPPHTTIAGIGVGAPNACYQRGTVELGGINQSGGTVPAALRRADRHHQ